MPRFNSVAVYAWSMVGAALFAWAVIMWARDQANEQRYDEEVALAAVQQHFWLVVAGQERGQVNGVLNKLARDLRDLPVSEVADFRGDSNRYGGITEELGFDPFNGINCRECGPLSSEMQETTRAVKRGRLGAVIADLHVPAPAKGFGPPLILWFIWLFSLPAYYVGTAISERQHRERRYKGYETELSLMHALDEAKHGLPPAQADVLAGLRNKIDASVQERIVYGETAAAAIRLEALIEEAQQTLDALNEGNRVLEKGE